MNPMSDFVLTPGITGVVGNWTTKGTPMVHRIDGCYKGEHGLEERTVAWAEQTFAAETAAEATGQPRSFWFCERCCLRKKASLAKKAAAATAGADLAAKVAAMGGSKTAAPKPTVMAGKKVTAPPAKKTTVRKTTAAKKSA